MIYSGYFSLRKGFKSDLLFFRDIQLTATRQGDSTPIINADLTSNALGWWHTNLSLPTGRFNLAVQATDRGGNVGPSLLWEVVIDPISPTVVLTAPIAARPTFTVEWLGHGVRQMLNG